MFPNLDAEMARENKKQTDVAMILGISESTVSDKMNGKTDFKLKECKKIIFNFFPGFSIDYLFATKEEIVKK